MHIQTELGRKSLGELCCFSKDRVSATFANAYNYVSVDNLLPDKKGKTLASSTPDRGYLFQYQIGDILLGNIRPYLKKIWFADITGTTNGDVLVVRTRRENSISPRFVYYVLSSDDFFAYSMQNAKGTKMPRGDKEAIMNYEFLVPPLEEQERIASALSSVDELIASLDKQIDKTRDIKQGAMNRLLSDTDTSHAPLREVAKIIRGIRVTKSKLACNGTYPVVSGGTGYMGYINEYNREPETITIAQYGTAGYVGWQTQRFWANDVCFSVIPDIKLMANKFLYYLLENKQEYLYSISNRDATPFSIDREKILSIYIPIPPLARQEYIADVLTSFDDTIEGLEAKRQKYEFVKAGMMQQLLSGATCYVNS